MNICESLVLRRWKYFSVLMVWRRWVWILCSNILGVWELPAVDGWELLDDVSDELCTSWASSFCSAWTECELPGQMWRGCSRQLLQVRILARGRHWSVLYECGRSYLNGNWWWSVLFILWSLKRRGMWKLILKKLNMARCIETSSRKMKAQVCTLCEWITLHGNEQSSSLCLVYGRSQGNHKQSKTRSFK